MRVIPLCAFLGLVALAGPAQAQNDCLKELSWPAVGRWAAYSSLANGKTVHHVELQEVGQGAKSSITETPREMPGLAAPAR